MHSLTSCWPIPRIPASQVNGTGPSTSTPASAPLQSLPNLDQAPAAATGNGDFQLLGATQEAINGRSAMLGFVAAMLAEVGRHQGVWSQVRRVCRYRA